jgi:acyl-CoA thioesterase-1
MIRSVFFILLAMPFACLANDNVFSRTASRLQNDGKLTIGYFGGSLTHGSGASDVEKTSWRAKVTEWFRQKFPRAEIKAVNAAIGGTGSDLGVFRLGTDLLESEPDLIFVEFAVNDDGRARGAKESVIPHMEGIVRQIWRKNPRADIVFVFTTMQKWEPELVEGQVPPSVEAHGQVAAHYGIPTVDIGAALWETVRTGRNSWEKIAPDKVHPNDAGYAIYSDAILKFLEAQDWKQTSEAPVALLDKLRPGSLEGARFVDFRQAEAPGWEILQRKVGLRGECLTSNKPGDELTFPFTGDAVGVFWLSADDSGDIEWSVDGSPFKTASSWSPHGGADGRGYSRMLQSPGSLKAGDHVLKLRVSGAKHEKSVGNWIRIAAFLVNQP